MKNVPKSIQIRLSNNSMNEEAFKEAAGPHNTDSKENGHSYILTYKPNYTRQENSRANPITEELNEIGPTHIVLKKEET